MYVPRAMYSFSTSFWIVPLNFLASALPRCAATMYIASRMDAVALIVIDVETFSRLMPSNSRCMSSIESIATPTFPTSPSENSLSES
jgi:hypothetical protein